MTRGVFVLGVAAALTVAFGVACSTLRQQQDEPHVNVEFVIAKDSGFLCEWHYPATNGVPESVEVCYDVGYAIQCYRIVGDRVTDYHSIDSADYPPPDNVTDYHSDRQNRFGRVIRLITESEEWRRCPDLPQHERDLLPDKAFDLSYQAKWRVHAMQEAEELARPFGADGYVSVLAWEWRRCTYVAGYVSTGLWAVAVFPLDKASPAVNALRGKVQAFMADPSTRKPHALYLRACPVLPPERPGRIPVLEARWKAGEFGCRQRDVLRFIPSMGSALTPIEKGVRPFNPFGKPFVPGTSLTLNYRSKKGDNFWNLNGDNFWRVDVYGGDEE